MSGLISSKVPSQPSNSQLAILQFAEILALSIPTDDDRRTAQHTPLFNFQIELPHEK